MMEVRMEDVLREYARTKIVYFPNPGNAGDSLIAAGTFQAFDRAGVRYRLPSTSATPRPHEVVFYGGGGNLVGETYAYRLISRLHRRVGSLVILPHTVKDVDGLLAEFGANVTLICRERHSYRYATAAAPKARVLLAHDMALHCDPHVIVHTNDLRSRLRAASALARAAIAGQGRVSLRMLPSLLSGAPVRAVSAAAPAGRTLHALRTDGERTAIALPPDNVDVSGRLEMGCAPREVADYVAGAMLALLDRYDVVVTNRLHVAIGAALLGKTVHMHANNYYKNRAVYEYSLRDRFPHVAWIDGDSAGTPPGPIASAQVIP